MIIRKLDRLKMNPRGATNEVSTCAVPMHAPQTSTLWREVGEVSSACEVGCFKRVQGTTRLLSEEGKLRILFVKCQGCGSNSEKLIRPSNSDVSGTLRYPSVDTRVRKSDSRVSK